MEQNSTTSKLMTPLFYDGSFNREGRKMRAIFEREVSDGTNTYRLWRSAGKPDLDYPSAENDAYILHVQIGDYLAPLGFTDFRLIDRCGFPAAVKELYGGKEGRETYFGQLRTLPDADNLVKEVIRREEKEIIRFGTDPVLQAGYIKAFLDQKSKPTRTPNVMVERASLTSSAPWLLVSSITVQSWPGFTGKKAGKKGRKKRPNEKLRNRYFVWSKTAWQSRLLQMLFRSFGLAAF